MAEIDDDIIAEVLKFDPMRKQAPATAGQPSEDDIIAEVLKFDPMRQEQPEESGQVVGGFVDTPEIDTRTSKPRQENTSLSGDSSGIN